MCSTDCAHNPSFKQAECLCRTGWYNAGDVSFIKCLCPVTVVLVVPSGGHFPGQVESNTGILKRAVVGMLIFTPVSHKHPLWDWSHNYNSCYVPTIKQQLKKDLTAVAK